MHGHLTDRDMMEALHKAPSGEVRDHLAGCPSCRAERERLQAALTGFAEQAHAWADRSDAAWDRQARQILARPREAQGHTLRWRWACVPALLGLAALAGLCFHGQSLRVSPPLENDEALLAAVDRSIQAEVPAALRPVTLLLGEVEDGQATRGRDGRQGG